MVMKVKKIHIFHTELLFHVTAWFHFTVEISLWEHAKNSSETIDPLQYKTFACGTNATQQTFGTKLLQ